MTRELRGAVVIALAMGVGLLAGLTEAAPAFDVRPYQRAFCAESGCCVLEVIPAGKGGKGEALEVVMLDHGGPSEKPRCPQAVLHDAAAKYERELELERNADEATEPAAGEENCHSYSYELAVKVGGKIVRRHSLVGICNDGYGAANVGSDSIWIDSGARVLWHRQSGGSNWLWTTTAGVGLDPPRLIESGSSTSFKLSTVEEEKDWSWDRFAGKTRSTVVLCGSAGNAPEGTEKTAEGSAVLIPSVTLPESFRAGGWRTTSLGGCAVKVDGAGAGFVVHGKAGSPKDARMRVVASPQEELFIEIEDDLLVGPGAALAGKSWVTDDHVEFWTADDRGFSSCRNDKQKGRQWAVRLTDGKVFAGQGQPALPILAAEVERQGHVMRLKLLSVSSTYLTVVYSDSDDGKTQERLIATSAVSSGKAATLGTRFAVPEERARCVLDDKGALLRPKVKPPADKDQPLSRDEKFVE